MAKLGQTMRQSLSKAHRLLQQILQWRSPSSGMCRVIFLRPRNSAIEINQWVQASNPQNGARHNMRTQPLSQLYGCLAGSVEPAGKATSLFSRPCGLAHFCRNPKSFNSKFHHEWHGTWTNSLEAARHSRIWIDPSCLRPKVTCTRSRRRFEAPFQNAGS
jgi:hypothetical protein